MIAKRADTRRRWESLEMANRVRTYGAGGHPARSTEFYRRHRGAVVACCLLLVLLMSASACALQKRLSGDECTAASFARQGAQGGQATAAPAAQPLVPIDYSTAGVSPATALPAQQSGHQPVAGGGFTWTRSQLIGLYVLRAPRFVPDWTRDQLLGLYVLTAPRYVPNWTRDQLLGLYVLTAPRYVPDWTRDQLLGLYIQTAPRYVPNWTRDQLLGVYTLRAQKYFGDP
jgi:hypothetical protein